MDRPTKPQKANIRKIIPLVIIGVGLIILGLVAAQVITSGYFTNDISVVPSVVNFPAPELTLNDLKGNVINISDYRRNIVLINNWATWCPPCKAEMPTLLKYYNAHTEQGFMLFGIEAGDPAEEVVKFVDDYGLSLPNPVGPQQQVIDRFS